MKSKKDFIISTVPLGKLIELIIDHRGKTPKKLGGDFTNEGVPVISAIHIKSGRIQWAERERFVSIEMFKKWMPTKLRKNDVLLTSEAPLGEIALVPSDDNLVLSQRLFAIRCRAELLDPIYLLYFFKSSTGQNALLGKASGSTVVGIRQSELLKIDIPLPSLNMQNLIGVILSSLDAKISTNQSISKTLEEIAQTIFKSWFIDFDPVKAKMAGEKPVGMDDETAALFPDSMEDSELGPIPKGWEISLLGRQISVIKGKSYKSSELMDSDTALVTLKSFLRGGGYRIDGLKPYIGEYKPNQEVHSGDLIVSFTDVTQAAEVIGKPALVLPTINFKTLVASLDVGIVRPLVETVGTRFLYELFRTARFESHIQGYSSGTTVLHLGKGAFEDFRFVSPEVNVVRKFEIITLLIQTQIESLHLQNLFLIQIRDSLLPRLISGELQIPDEMLVS